MKPAAFSVLILLAAAVALAGDPAVRYVPAPHETAASVVPSSLPLVHTAQLLSPREEPMLAVSAVEKTLAAHGGDPARIVKLNVVAATQAIADEARAAVYKRYPSHVRPPMSIVVGALPDNHQIGIDAVAVATSDAPAHAPTSAARTLPAGPRVYVSGQAEKGATPAEAAEKTIASLLKTLESVGIAKGDVVQAKCFLTPMSASRDVVGEFAKVFGKQALPLVFVEWKSDLPVEIELIAAAPVAGGDVQAIQYLTPPGMNGSPLFARVVRINRGDLIYTAGLYADEPGAGEAQVLSIFDQLQRVMKDAGGDMKHLAKATYCVSDADASKQLNVLRPKFYDPQRPPAASKATVPGVGMTDRSISIDMIGVVAPRTGSD